MHGTYIVVWTTQIGIDQSKDEYLVYPYHDFESQVQELLAAKALYEGLQAASNTLVASITQVLESTDYS